MVYWFKCRGIVMKERAMWGGGWDDFGGRF
jgi:hypothetical protein